MSGTKLDFNRHEKRTTEPVHASRNGVALVRNLTNQSMNERNVG